MNHSMPIPNAGSRRQAPRRRLAWPFVLFLLTPLLGCGKSAVLAPVPLPPLSAVTVSPKTDTLSTGQSVTLTATALDTLGAMVGGAAFTWTSSNPSVASVSGSGAVRANGEGVASIVASAGGKSDSATIVVIVHRGWFLETSNTSNDLNGVFFLGDRRTGWAVGAGGRIVATTDAGSTWGIQVSNTLFNLNSVWFTSGSEGWAVGAGGAVLHTLDAGVHWNSVVSNASENLLDVWFATPDTGWVVGAQGVVLRTFDRGASWQRLQPTAFDLLSVSFSGTRDGWAVGNGGVILGTHDRGLTWFVVQPSLTAQALRAVWRRSASEAWVAGQAGVTPRTVVTADSVAWELRNAGATNDLEGVCYPTSSIGYAVGTNGGVGAALRTDDGGVTWQSQSTNTQFRLKDVFFVDDRTGWAVGRNGTILHTSTGGLP
jgi:photosystem II stability/assembly factor-like uncharacterized protein